MAPQSPTGVMPVSGYHSSTSSPFCKVFSSSRTSATWGGGANGGQVGGAKDQVGGAKEGQVGCTNIR